MKITPYLTEISDLKERLTLTKRSHTEHLLDILDIAQIVTRSERSTLFKYEADLEQLVSHASHGLLTTIYLNLNEGIVGTCASLKESIIENDVDCTKSFNSTIDVESGFVTRNTLTVPVMTEDKKLLGVLQVLNKDQEPYTQRDEELLVSIALLSLPFIGLSVAKQKGGL